jgi:DNA mismatch repair protein MutS
MQDAASLTPMFRQYRALKAEHPGTILLFRMGDFYEMFYEDAQTASGALDLTLTARGKGTAHEAPMCGFPHHQLGPYTAKLVRAGHRVAVCDQVEDPRTAKGLVKREVVRIVTPGTQDDPGELDAGRNAWIASVAVVDHRPGAAFLDVSTGDFLAWEATDESDWEALDERLAAFAPREIVHAADVPWPGERRPDPARCTLTAFDAFAFVPASADDLLKRQFEVATLAGFGLSGHASAIAAAGGLLAYVRDTVKSDLRHVDGVALHEPARHLAVDAASFRNLEIDRSLRDGGRAGSLLGAIDRTITAPGARLLRTWIGAPLLERGEIATRLDAVQELLDRPALRAGVRDRLRGFHDVSRLLARAVAGSASARDLLMIRGSLERLPGLLETLAEARASVLADASRVDPCADVSARLAAAVHDEPPQSLREGGLLKDGFHPEIDELRGLRRDGRSTIASLETREREASGIGSLKVRFNKVFGYYIEVSKSNLHLVPGHYQRKQTIAGGERFVTPELKDYETKILSAEERLETLEYELFAALRAEVAAEARRIKAAVAVAAILDVVSGLAQLAEERDYRRPALLEDPVLSIRGGRHPVVEQAIVGTRFTPNDTSLGPPEASIAILTGPNMGGKSTYLRQVALIALLAQSGSFVPAEEAALGIVDRIFCRVGASDNLAEGQSTFMVEMAETANILHHATPRSLVLLDEIGRGTATFDGLAIAWAVVEHLHQWPGGAPRTLFATHYHELTELAVTLAGVSNLRMAVREWGDRVVFTHRVEVGAADRSYGIHVARLAGVPQPVVERAKEVLQNLERDEYGGDGLPRRARRGGRGPSSARPGERSLFAPGGDVTPAPADPASAEVLAEIRRQDPERLSPLEALRLLDGWSRKLGKRPGS